LNLRFLVLSPEQPPCYPLSPLCYPLSSLLSTKPSEIYQVFRVLSDKPGNLSAKPSVIAAIGLVSYPPKSRALFTKPSVLTTKYYVLGTEAQ